MNRKLPPLGRRSNFRDPKRKFKIITEGKNTEPQYFKALNKAYPGALIDLEVVAAAGVPLTIANKAISAKSDLDKNKKKFKNKSFLSLDEVWVVFDKDTHPNILQAINVCENANVGVGFSNPCFELWLILHYQDFDRPDDHHQVQKELEKLCKTYDKDKGKSFDCSAILPNLELAENRAERQVERRNQEGKKLSPPYTTVFKLTRKLRSSSDEHFKKT